MLQIITDRNISNLTVVFLATLIIVVIVSVVSYFDILITILHQDLTSLRLLIKNQLEFILKEIVVLSYFSLAYRWDYQRV